MVPIFLLLLLCINMVSMENVHTDDNEECEHQMCALQKDLLSLKTLIAIQNTEIANQNVQIERQNVRIADQNTRIVEEVVKVDQLKSDIAVLQREVIQQQKEIESLRQRAVSHKDCPQGWLQHAEQCYLIVNNDTQSWTGALGKCKEHGGHLAVIKGESTNNFLKEMSRLSEGTYIWFGASDREVEGTWVWENNGEQIDFSDWQKNQPDDYRTGQDCTLLNKNFNYRWDDGSCSFSTNYICQLDI